MRRIVIGTAGHIDHGKTSLVKALTGVDTDRLKEEKKRGITIELGFAHLPLPDGTVAGIVDVPGHERFVKAMAAGAAGIDLVMLVVALDEGVMPQTREHLDICRLLGVPRGVIVVTKADLKPELGDDWVELLEGDLKEATKGTFLEDAPIVHVSSKTAEGIDGLKQALAKLAKDTPERPADGPLYLPVDRAFSLKGFGTVVTGTLLSGSLAPEDEVDLIPEGVRGTRVRSVQVHGADVKRAQAGQRTAVNLPDVEAKDVPRGTVIVGHGVVAPTHILDVELDALAIAPRPVKHRSRFLLHLGTAQVPAIVALLDAEIAPGARGFAQLRLGAPAAALPGQRFILRGFTQIPGRGTTVAGGRVLAIHARKRRRTRQDAREGLPALSGGDAAARVAHLLKESGFRGLTLTELFSRTALPERALAKTLEVMSSKSEVLLFDKERRAYASPAMAERLAQRIAAAVKAHRELNPLAPGIGKEELKQKLGTGVDPKLFTRLLAAMTDKGALFVDGDVVREKSAPPPMAASDDKVKVDVAKVLSDAGLTPPYVDDLPKLVNAPPPKVSAVVKLLEKEGRIVRVNQELYFDAAAVGALREKLVAFLKSHGKITTQEFKELVSATRKFTIPLGEYFDVEKVTLRVGDARVLRGSAH